MNRGDWQRIEDRIFSPRRVALYAGGLLLCYAVFLATGYFHGLWLIDGEGRGRAIDFVAAWAAARLAVSGHAASAYDLAVLAREQLTAVAALYGDYPWAYPPTYFLLIAPLALFSYVAGALVWMVGTLALYGAGIGAILPRRSAVLAAAASPFALWCFYAGQNGFLTAALIAGVLALLDRRPIVAGILLGLLTMKPQLGIVFPLILALTGRWRVFGAAAATAIVLALLSFLLFGAGAWRAFLLALQTQSGAVLDRGDVLFYKQQTVHAVLRLLGAGEAFAWTAHVAVALSALGFTAWLWRQPVDDRLKAAALAMTALLATPYLFLYDLPILSVPLVFLASLGSARGFIPGERSLLAVLMPVLLVVGGPVGVPVLLALWLLIVLRVPSARTA